jgi:hypothetical protein
MVEHNNQYFKTKQRIMLLNYVYSRKTQFFRCYGEPKHTSCNRQARL